MRPLSATLNDLIGFAEQSVTKPSRFLPPVDKEVFTALAAEVREAEARPAENIRTTRAAVMMINALEGFYQSVRDPAGSDNLQNQWLMLAGATLPLLRVDAWCAFNNEKQARAA